MIIALFLSTGALNESFRDVCDSAVLSIDQSESTGEIYFLTSENAKPQRVSKKHSEEVFKVLSVSMGSQKKICYRIESGEVIHAHLLETPNLISDNFKDLLPPRDPHSNDASEGDVLRKLHEMEARLAIERKRRSVLYEENLRLIKQQSR